MIYLGIDPGAHGGITAVCDDSVVAIPMPATERDLWEYLSPFGPPAIRHPKQLPQTYAVLEKVGGYVASDKDRPGMGPSMFSFGRNYGSIYMALIAARIPFDLVPAKRWQKFHSAVKMKGETKTVWKNKLKGIAQRLFPTVKVTLAISDSLLIAEYARRNY